MLTLVQGEVDGPPTYYVVDKLCDALGLPVPAVSKVVKALEVDGFHVFPTHFTSKGFRSDALASKIQGVVRWLTALRDKS